jgi:hypothetical protein
MEPLNESARIDMESQETDKKTMKAPERISLLPLDAERLDQWLKNIAIASKGFLNISRGDLVSFLIRSHKDELSTAEMKKLRSDHYDPIRHIQWITPQIKAALASSDLARVAELQEELRSVELPSSNAGHAVTGGDSGSSAALGTTKKVRKRSNKVADSKSVASPESPPV